MFKKTVSNAPRRQLSKIHPLLERRPLVSLILMVAAMLGSLVYLLASRPSAKTTSESYLSNQALAVPISNGITGIISTATALADIVKLQGQLDVFLAKDSLTALDSAAMERALDHIKELEKQLALDQQFPAQAVHDTIN